MEEEEEEEEKGREEGGGDRTEDVVAVASGTVDDNEEDDEDVREDVGKQMGTERDGDDDDVDIGFLSIEPELTVVTLCKADNGVDRAAELSSVRLKELDSLLADAVVRPEDADCGEPPTLDPALIQE